jgi:hypothetical protein
MTPDDASTWERDARTLLAEFGDVWQIVRAADDPLVLVCERQAGTELRVVAGTPAVCLRRIREIPAVAGCPAVGCPDD